MTHLIIDIETIPNETADRPEFDPDSVRAGNIKDPAKIADKVAEARSQFESGLTKRMSLSSDYCRIVSLGMLVVENKNIVDEITVYGESSDNDIIAEFKKIYSRDKHLIGWNSKQFDIPILWKRGILLGNPIVFDYLSLISKYREESTDLMHIWNAYEYGKLSDCAKALKIPCKSGLDGSMIFDAWKAGKEKEIREYNLEDCRACYEIAKAINIL